LSVPFFVFVIYDIFMYVRLKQFSYQLLKLLSDIQYLNCSNQWKSWLGWYSL